MITKVVCRRCRSNDMERIRRSQLMKSLLPWLPLKHYRCLKCGRNAYHRNILTG